MVRGIRLHSHIAQGLIAVKRTDFRIRCSESSFVHCPIGLKLAHTAAAFENQNGSQPIRHRFELSFLMKVDVTEASKGAAVSLRLSHIAKVDLVQQRMVYPELVVVQAWTTSFRLMIDRENKQAKEAIQSDG
ncbi:hypothetical protein TNCV_740231 [Trichonephila clavipes]|nr:hypothetical protein TNCV_740231 [Trichonephila clavipes]